jgi:hypothetical protein
VGGGMKLKGENMNTEDDEFERIEREFKWRKIVSEEIPTAIPLITEEEWQALNEISEA